MQGVLIEHLFWARCWAGRRTRGDTHICPPPGACSPECPWPHSASLGSYTSSDRPGPSHGPHISLGVAPPPLLPVFRESLPLLPVLGTTIILICLSLSSTLSGTVSHSCPVTLPLHLPVPHIDVDLWRIPQEPQIALGLKPFCLQLTL